MLVEAFRAAGWGWGGSWSGSVQDYQHFSAQRPIESRPCCAELSLPRSRRSATAAPRSTRTASGRSSISSPPAGSTACSRSARTARGSCSRSRSGARRAELFLEASAGPPPGRRPRGAQSTADTVALAAHAAEQGADAVAVIAPPYFPLDDVALLEHFTAAAAACAPLPFYVYEFARTSGYAVPPDVVDRLRERAPNLAGMKVSDRAVGRASSRYLIEGLDVFVGSEALIGQGLAAGAVGAVSALASAFPEVVAAAVARRGRRRRAALRRRSSAFRATRRSSTCSSAGACRSARTCARRCGGSPTSERERARRGARLPAPGGVSVAAQRDPGRRRQPARPGVRPPVRDAARRRAVRRGRDARRGGRHAAPPERAGPAHQHDAARRVRQGRRGGAGRSSRPTRRCIRRIDAEGLQTNVALKLTHLGVAARRGARATRTSSGSSRTRRGSATSSASTWRTRRWSTSTLRIYRRLREAGHDNVGTVLQAYLYRTEQDLESLLPLQPNLRIVKGAYKEPPEVAYPKKADVDAAYARLVERDARGGGLHRGRDARRAADRARDLARPRPRAHGAPDALRRPAAAAARSRRAAASACSSRPRTARTGSRT